MKKNFLKEWLNSLCFPMPVLWAPIEAWDEFANNATFSRVKDAFKENKDCVISCHCRKKMEIVLQRLAKGNWPMLTDEFIRESQLKIWKISSLETLDYEIQSYDFVEPRYLVDSKNQMLGILVSKNVVITGFVNERVKAKLVEENLLVKGVLPTKEQMEIIGMYKDDINRLLCGLGLEFELLGTSYWVDACNRSAVWVAPSYFRPCMGDDDLAGLIFLA